VTPSIPMVSTGGTFQFLDPPEDLGIRLISVPIHLGLRGLVVSCKGEKTLNWFFSNGLQY